MDRHTPTGVRDDEEIKGGGRNDKEIKGGRFMFPALWIASDLSVVAMTKKKRTSLRAKRRHYPCGENIKTVFASVAKQSRAASSARSFYVSRPVDRHTPDGVRDC